jgi:hypothetical protein
MLRKARATGNKKAAWAAQRAKRLHKAAQSASRLGKRGFHGPHRSWAKKHGFEVDKPGSATRERTIKRAKRTKAHREKRGVKTRGQVRSEKATAAHMASRAQKLAAFKARRKAKAAASIIGRGQTAGPRRPIGRRASPRKMQQQSIYARARAARTPVTKPRKRRTRRPPAAMPTFRRRS